MPQILDEKDLQTTKNPGLYNKTTPPPNYPRAMKKQEANKRLMALRAEYLLWRPAHQELSKYINPLRGKFDTPPQKRPQLPDYKIILDNHATQASNVLASGLSSGMTNQTMPWLRLTIADQQDTSDPVREWLDECQKVIYRMLDRSNLYGSLNNCYEELGIFGTGCFMVLEDFDSIVRGRDFTVGEYYLGCDKKGRVNSFGRQFWMTAGQMVEEFGYDNCSPAVRQNFDYNLRDIWYYVNHLIEPNDTRIGQMSDYQNMPFRSVYWDNNDHTEIFLACRGFRKFPVIAPRWNTFTTDQAMGYGPGWYALGNVKQLQKVTYDKLVSEEKAHNPPLQADANVDHISTIPGGVTKLTTTGEPNAGVRPAYLVQHDAQGFELAINKLYEMIDKDFFVNLFIMLMNFDKSNMTATEIAERQQEKIMMMGPILYKLKTELFDPLIELLWDIAVEDGLIPDAPEEIQGMPIKVEYTSILAQAQKSLGVNQINRVIGYVASLNAVNPQLGMLAADVIDFDESVRQVADMEGVPGKIIRDPALVEAKRQKDAQMMQAQQMLSAGAEGADALAKLGRVPMDGGKSNAAEKYINANVKR